MALPRVYDLAKELGIDTKVALAKLEELGEYVKGGSSTIAPPVAAKLRSSFPKVEKPAVKPPEPKAAPKSEPPKPIDPTLIAPEAPVVIETPKPPAPAPTATEPPAAEEAAAAASSILGIPRPGNNPFSSNQGMGIPRPMARREIILSVPTRGWVVRLDRVHRVQVALQQDLDKLAPQQDRAHRVQVAHQDQREPASAPLAQDSVADLGVHQVVLQPAGRAQRVAVAEVRGQRELSVRVARAVRPASQSAPREKNSNKEMHRALAAP